MHVRSYHLVRIRHAARHHLSNRRRHHELRRREIASRLTSSRRELQLELLVHGKLDDDVRYPRQRRRQTAVQSPGALLRGDAPERRERAAVGNPRRHGRPQRLRVLHLKPGLDDPQRVSHEHRGDARAGGAHHVPEMRRRPRLAPRGSHGLHELLETLVDGEVDGPVG